MFTQYELITRGGVETVFLSPYEKWLGFHSKSPRKASSKDRVPEWSKVMPEQSFILTLAEI